EPVYQALRAKYAAHIERLLKLAGRTDGVEAAKSILELETEIARAHWPRAKRRERDLTYNPHAREELSAFAPGFPWPALLGAAGLEAQPPFIVREPAAPPAISGVFAQTPVGRGQTYLNHP